ncbi:hypothetical protein PROFUN_05129 [Planoprotostelium fungivorum]|uniref:Uncharacterized protein n=1 Tax=Planoprotostelium fungivorum TaxID=1890364 RepID=A0A2P6NRV8_9EUKA|nr:hypothetical protein PROFUN_05129 [Planoprotostelium fungivorum]
MSSHGVEEGSTHKEAETSLDVSAPIQGALRGGQNGARYNNCKNEIQKKSNFRESRDYSNTSKRGMERRDSKFYLPQSHQEDLVRVQCQSSYEWSEIGEVNVGIEVWKFLIEYVRAAVGNNFYDYVQIFIHIHEIFLDGSTLNWRPKFAFDSFNSAIATALSQVWGCDLVGCDSQVQRVWEESRNKYITDDAEDLERRRAYGGKPYKALSNV